MNSYRVTHKAGGGVDHVLAGTASEAIERVTLVLGNVEGSSAWQVKAEQPSYPLSRGVVLDGAGNPVKSLEA